MRKIKELIVCVSGILLAACKKTFSSSCYHIIGKNIDDLTKKATFMLKSKKLAGTIKLKTSKILFEDQYFVGLDPRQRKLILDQYLLEQVHPLAYIQEYPISPNKNQDLIFKIMLIEKVEIICGTATYFYEEKREILSLLSKEDLRKITVEYHSEKFLCSTDKTEISKKLNVYRLK